MKNKPSKNAHPKEEKSIDQNNLHINSSKKTEEKTTPIKEDNKERRCSNSDLDSGSGSKSDKKEDGQSLIIETCEGNKAIPGISMQLAESVRISHPLPDSYETEV